MEKRMKTLIWISILSLTWFTIAGCSSSNNAKEDKVTLEETRWELRAYGDREDPQKILKGTLVTAFFNKAEASVSGSAGCNIYGGAYNLEAYKLSVNGLFSTMMYCQDPENMMQQEQQFLTLLSNATDYQLTKDYLQINCEEDQVLLFENPVEIQVDMDHNGTQITLDKGDYLLVSLDSNPSTGFQWEVTEINTSILQQIGESAYVASEQTDPPSIGTGGIEIFRFKAIESGISTLKLLYKQPWEDDSVITYSIEVLINK